jgi:hypothetical protein
MAVARLFMTRANVGSEPAGPFSAQQLRQLAGSGLLHPTALVAVEGTDQWVQAAKVKGLYPDRADATPEQVVARVPDSAATRSVIPHGQVVNVITEATHPGPTLPAPTASAPGGFFVRASSIGVVSALPITAVYPKLWGYVILLLGGAFVIGMAAGLIP